MWPALPADTRGVARSTRTSDSRSAANGCRLAPRDPIVLPDRTMAVPCAATAVSIVCQAPLAVGRPTRRGDPQCLSEPGCLSRGWHFVSDWAGQLRWIPNDPIFESAVQVASSWQRDQEGEERQSSQLLEGWSTALKRAVVRICGGSPKSSASCLGTSALTVCSPRPFVACSVPCPTVRKEPAGPRKGQSWRTTTACLPRGGHPCLVPWQSGWASFFLAHLLVWATSSERTGQRHHSRFSSHLPAGGGHGWSRKLNLAGELHLPGTASRLGPPRAPTVDARSTLVAGPMARRHWRWAVRLVDVAPWAPILWLRNSHPEHVHGCGVLQTQQKSDLSQFGIGLRRSPQHYQSHTDMYRATLWPLRRCFGLASVMSGSSYGQWLQTNGVRRLTRL